MISLVFQLNTVPLNFGFRRRRYNSQIKRYPTLVSVSIAKVNTSWSTSPSLLLPNRSIVREQRPSFEGSFIETCLFLVGNISGVWGRFGGVFFRAGGGGHRPAPGPATERACMLDMLLVPAGSRLAPLAQVSAREAFSLACLFAARKACEVCFYLSHVTII